MDDALVQFTVKDGITYKVNVLILVVMDDALVRLCAWLSKQQYPWS